MNPFLCPLSPTEEKALLEEMKCGDNKKALNARQKLVEHNLRLVAHIAKKYQNTGEDMEDLISIGSIGLLKAIDSFDEKKGRLATYACRCIDNELLMLMRSRKKKAKEVSLYEPIGKDRDGNEIRLFDIVEHEKEDILESMDLSVKRGILSQLIHDTLTERERAIILLRYGLWTGEEITQSEVGEELGISRSYVSRLEKKALNKLREAFRKKGFEN